MKRLIASIASIALLCSLSIFPVAATKDTGIYADVKGHWGQAAMETWSERGVLRGSGGFCRPDDAITRGELAVLLQRVVGYQNASGHSFS
ncbi:MAG: S-layer homology domain-containing protein, partial [Oscillospiraceae bacterium]